MDLCKTCIFIEVDREKECYWCVLRNLELTNYYNIETCDDCIIEIKEVIYAEGNIIWYNKSAKNC